MDLEEKKEEGIPEVKPAEAIVELEPLKFDPNKKVAIVGTSHSWMLAPFDDPSVEIWGVNNAFINIGKKRKTRWFDVHFIEHRPDAWYRRWKKDFRGQLVSKYIEDLAKLDCPVYMQQEWPEIPNSKRFPVEKVIQYFGKYITNSISMQMAYALCEGFGEIQIWGVDMSAGTEWAYQRPNAEYFMGIAVGLGVKVVVPAESDLLKTLFMYAYEEKDKSTWIKKTDVITNHINTKINKTAANIQQTRGELDRLEKILEQQIGQKQGIVDLRKLWVNDFKNYYYPE